MKQEAQLAHKSTTPAHPAHKVTKDMLITDIVAKHPAAIEVMLGYGLHCIGCHMSAVDTLEAGAMTHGMTEEDIDKMVDEINERLEDTGTGDELKITKKASEKLKELLKGQKGMIGMRINVVPGGCAGFEYEFDFEKGAKDADVTIDANGVSVFINEKSMSMLRGATIDYVDALQGAGFRISNPNAKSTCSCGHSFS